ncbi:MAG TPA: hypothetical protein VLJ76_05295 [Gaiellaceae bacterium]|nr:hypothetical protein [Gaiellaceae bacterium]
MTETRPSEFLAECFWPGVSHEDLRELDERAAAAAARLTGSGRPVRYAGSLLMRADEVVLCLFEGAELDVRAAAELAAIPFERVLEAIRSPWPASDRP